jgi:hydrogenase nickel incorporation protein HypA/HybF
VHELSLCCSIYDIVGKALASRPGHSVEAVNLQVGQLRQVVPESLEFCWGMVTQDSPLAGSMLVIDQVPVVLDCLSCGESTTAADVFMLTCGSCGGGTITVRTGEEFMVTSLDVVADDVVAPSERS